MTAQIVTIPLNKEGWNKGDLINNGSLGYSLALYDNKAGIDDWQAQQLLVLSNDEIQETCNWYFDDTNQLRKNVMFDKEYWSKRKKYKAVLASYPQLPNTLPIAKETVQVWIDSDTPIEGSVETDKEFDDWYEQMELNSYPSWKPTVDPQGNLPLNFDKPIDKNYPEEYELTQNEAKEWCQSVQTNQKNIENAAQYWYKHNYGGLSIIKPPYVINAFIAGAEWQKQQNNI